MSRILITGGLGQLGVSLTHLLRQRIPSATVLATDIRKSGMAGYQTLNVLDKSALQHVVTSNRIDCVIHLAALLSYKAEMDIQAALNLNLQGVHNVLDVAKDNKLMVFCPSTIGVYGFPRESSLRVNVPDNCVQHPQTIYGISKTHLELMGNYYYRRFGVDFRSLRLPGIISKPPASSTEGQLGGGTTDYAVDMMVQAFKKHKKVYECPLTASSEMPFMWIDDCLEGIYSMITNQIKAQDRTYNISGLSFTPEQLHQELIKCGLPLKVGYDNTDQIRTQIANSWPRSLDYSRATKDFGFQPEVTTLQKLIKVFKEA